MRKILSSMLILLLLSSCAVYTVGQGKASIHAPEVTGEPETRFRVIQERKEAEEAMEEKSRIEREEREKEEKRIEMETAVYEYPDDISELSLPHNYRPQRTHLGLETEKSPLRILFIPLEENADIGKISSSIRDLKRDFIFATGETEQLVALSESINEDTVLTEGGMVIYNTRLKKMDRDSASFNINDEKSIETVALSTFKGLPSSSDEIGEYLPLLEDESEKLDSITTDEETVIFALSSQEPSSDDWIPFTAYPYRESRQFTTSEWFKENGYIDVYRATHYSAETDPGITRESGDVFERMDFIYVKNAIPLSSVTFSVAGMTNRAIYSEVLIP